MHGTKTYRHHRLALLIAGMLAAVPAVAISATPAAAADDTTVVTIADTTARGDGSVPFATTGSWSPSAVTGPDGTASLYARATTATARWIPDVPSEGSYRVEAAIPDAPNSVHSATYVIGAADGDANVTIDQDATRGTWADLGVHRFVAGTSGSVTVTGATSEALNVRVGALRLVPAPESAPGTGLPFQENFETGMSSWTAMSASLDDWSVRNDEFGYTSIDTTGKTSGEYIRPAAAIELPENYRLDTSVRIDQIAGAGKVSILTDMLAPYSYTANNVATQFAAPSAIGDGVIQMANPNSKKTVCTGSAPFSLAEWFTVTVQRAGGITAVWVDSKLVAAISTPTAGGTIGLGVYQANASIGPISVTALSAVPDEQPATAAGCMWAPGSTDESQPVIANQTGFNLGQAKRFTAPKADDGDAFAITDDDGAKRYSGTITAHVGDFTAFNPSDTGPFTITVTGEAGTGTSFPFGIGADWMERVTYQRAVDFMTDVRCFYGDLSKATFGGTASDCLAGVGWRDSHQMSFELPSMIDLFLANPSVFEHITDPDATFTGVRYPLAADAPELVRLISWGAELYLKGQVNHTLLKEQLAAFLYAYPSLSQWIPVGLYDEVRDYLFPIWGDTAKDRYAWHDYTAHTADLFQTYTQIGTGKGEFPVGHSILPNLQMWQVAQRESRADADRYLTAAIDQATWIVDNVDPADPAVTKGQRQAEYHLMTNLALLADMVPADRVPAQLASFASAWADTAIGRSDNMWDFRKYSDDRWTIPSFTGGSSKDPNETGNVLGFPAAALAAVHIIGDGRTADRLREIAVAQVDDIFGRNPTDRASSYRGATADYGFEGIDLGWYSEFQGGNGKLQGARGVFDGSPKNAHYPYNPGLGNPGHSEGWVTFNTAWLEALAWRAYDDTAITLAASEAAPAGSVTVSLRAPLNMNTSGGNTGTVSVAVNGAPRSTAVVTQTAVNGLDYRATLDLAPLGVKDGDVVTVSYGLGYFARSAQLTVSDTVSPTDPGTPTDPSTPGTPGDSGGHDPAQAAGGGELAATGSSALGWADIAAMLIAAGFGIGLRRRRRRALR